jgi:hypothetical protein
MVVAAQVVQVVTPNQPSQLLVTQKLSPLLLVKVVKLLT